MGGGARRHTHRHTTAYPLANARARTHTRTRTRTHATEAELKEQRFTTITDIYSQPLVLNVPGSGRVGCWLMRGLSPPPDKVIADEKLGE